MKIVADNKIPYLKGALEPVAEVVYLPGGKISKNDVKDADVLITRTRTICNKDLLENTSVKFIATATIGYDHIDTNYCSAAGIEWTNAPGCNAGSVEQYIASVLVAIARERGTSLYRKKLGIIGVGNVGRKVARAARLLGMDVLLNDPPRTRHEGPEGFVSLDYIKRKADFISFHVPLNVEGADKTCHLADQSFFDSLEKRPIIINSCRGEVIDSQALKRALNKMKIAGAVLDCWENEPNIDSDILAGATIATPHIAGYSRDGKANGTRMSVQAVSRFFHLGLDDWQPAKIERPRLDKVTIDAAGKNPYQIAADAVYATYDVMADDKKLRISPETFEKLRENYPVRREYPAWTVRLQNSNSDAVWFLSQLGFNIEKI